MGKKQKIRAEVKNSSNSGENADTSKGQEHAKVHLGDEKIPSLQKVSTKTEEKSLTIIQLRSPEGRNCVIPKVDLFFNSILTSAHSVKSQSKIITVKGSLMSFNQVVVAAGINATVKVGDWVCINTDMFPKTNKPGGHDIGTVTTVHPPIEKIGGTTYLFMTDRHIKYRLQK